MSMSNITLLDEAFVDRKSYSDVISLAVKIIKQVKAKEFLVADATGYRSIELRGTVINQHKKNLREQNYVKIELATVDIIKQKIFLSTKTKIINIREFQVDETKPAKVCIYPFTINKMNYKRIHTIY